MAYLIFLLSLIALYVGLSVILHLQFGMTGIVNFGIVGFWGLGMYSFSIFIVTFGMAFLPAIALTILIVTAVALLLGFSILRLDGQAVLVTTLAFATIVKDLAITEKWLTHGVMGFGTIPFPFDIGRYSDVLFFAVLVVIVGLMVVYAILVMKSPYGRLLLAIRDNETLARSLGKRTFLLKVLFFAVTSGLIGALGALNASLNHFIYPVLLEPHVTFTVWIILIIGGKSRVFGGLIGSLVTLLLFDFIIELYVPIPRSFAQVMPNLKMMLYGLTLILILMFKPSGLLGEKKRVTPAKNYC